MDTDRNLLFGVLALQADLLSPGQFAEACSAWAGRKETPLADLLVERGWLSPVDRADVDKLLQRKLAKHGGNAKASLAELTTDEVRQSLAGLNDPVVRESLAGPTPPPQGHVLLATADYVPESRERYTLSRLHATGGIGRVWLARDASLGRDVALKELRPERAKQPAVWARFLKEAQITGQLEHPGIVPVYEVGRRPDDQAPFYTMRFVRGQTLAQAARVYHDRRARGEAGPLELRELLTAFMGVCHAVAYAHSRGVLHRDLKPQNVVLGDYGEVIVLDWGLAKVVGEVEGDAAPVALEADGDADSRSIAGQVLGTPAYMAPEQAEGRLDLLDVRTDVYGLGAVLYELLAGRPPFDGSDTTAVLQRVIHEPPEPPRAAVPSVPRALQAVCLKALAKRPADRYASAKELLEDVKHVLADESVTAYRERRLERLGRWFRKHRTWTYAAVAALICVCLAATVAAVVIEGSRRSEAEARREAEQNFSMAQKAVDNYLTSVSENTLLKEQDSVDVRNLRQELLQSALKYYQQFVSQRGQDPRLQQELANAHFRVGKITQEISSPREAIESFRSAQAIWERLAANEPENDELQGHVAACQFEIGNLEERAGDYEGALSSLSQAQAILEPLAARRPQVARLQANLADCLAEIGVNHARLDSPDQALAMLQKAKAIRQQLIERFPNDIGYQRSRAEIINELGYVFYKRLDYPAALRAFQEVQEICQSLLKQVQHGPKPVQILNWLALSYSNMASIQSTLGQKEQALRSSEQSLHHWSALVATHPSVTRFQQKLGTNYREFAELQHSMHQDDKAISSVHQSINIYDRLVQSQPDQALYHGELGLSWNLLGCLYDWARDNPKAIPAFRRAVAEQERAVAGQERAVPASKDISDYRGYLSNHIENLGEQYVDLGQVDEGFPHYLRALRLRKDLHLARPENREYALELSQALSKLAAVQRHAGRGGAARESLTQARELLEQLAATHSSDAAISGRLGTALTDEAVALAEEQKPEAALPVLARALDLLTPLGSAAKAKQEDRERLSEALWQLARIDRAIGKSADAVPIDAQRSALWKGRPAAELAALALKEGTRATLIGFGKTPISERAKLVRELDLDLAAADLRLAISQGFTDLAMLRSHPDSAVLLQRSDLKSLIKGLEARDRTSQPHPKK
ncbi:MAG TPA: protein kinase [Gemmataceae bacterium]|nr:protein kinase [Gemmataceae bacterium]